MSEPRVCVLVPSGGHWEAGFGYDLCKAMAWTASAGVSLNLFNVQGSILPSNRDQLVTAGKESGATHFMWFDDDMRFPKDTILRLLEHDKEIVCANYRMRNKSNKFTAYAQGVGYIPTTPDSEGLEKVTSVGFGVLMCKASAFEKIDRPYFIIGFNEKTGDYVIDDGFCCIKWHEAGIELFVDHDLSKEVKHIATAELSVDGNY